LETAIANASGDPIGLVCRSWETFGGVPGVLFGFSWIFHFSETLNRYDFCCYQKSWLSQSIAAIRDGASLIHLKAIVVRVVALVVGQVRRRDNVDGILAAEKRAKSAISKGCPNALKSARMQGISRVRSKTTIM
jgi:hypothetical protein